jgi:L-glyceraldehyde 3-phosphate reductase
MDKSQVLIGISSVAQLEDSFGVLDNRNFTKAELDEIDRHAKHANINIWSASSETPGPARRKNNIR